jgi:hypothetical protein
MYITIDDLKGTTRLSNRMMYLSREHPSKAFIWLPRLSSIPYEITWLHETAEQPPHDHPGYYEVENLGQLPYLLECLTQKRE